MLAGLALSSILQPRAKSGRWAIAGTEYSRRIKLKSGSRTNWLVASDYSSINSNPPLQKSLLSLSPR